MHKYANTQVHKYKDPTCAISLKSMGFKDIKFDIHVSHECHKGQEGHEVNEGHEGHKGHGTWHIIKHNARASRGPLNARMDLSV